MRKIQVKELMIPSQEYPRVSQGANLYDAITALEKAHDWLKDKTYRPRAVLVTDPAGRVVGKMSLWCVMLALEPKYQQIMDYDRYSHWGLNPEFLKSIIQHRELWADPMEYLCQSATRVMVKDVMTVPGENELVDEESSLSEAIHYMVMGRYLSLLVIRRGEIVGLIRLCDVFEEIAKRVKSCEV